MHAIDPVIPVVARWLLVGVFMAATAHKLRDMESFRGALADYELIPHFLIGVAAWCLVVVEAGVALGLMIPEQVVMSTGVAIALLGVYAAAMSINLIRGRRYIDCGCGGPATQQQLSEWLVLRNLCLAGLAVSGFAPITNRTLTWLDYGTVALAVIALFTLYVVVNHLVANQPGLARLRARRA